MESSQPCIIEEEPRLLLLVQDRAAGASHYDRSRFVPVEAGQEVGRLCGDRQAASQFVGEGLEVRVDGTVVALEAGTLSMEHGHARVQRVLQISGNVDFSTGNVEGPGDVTIAGSVADLFKVRSGGNLTIGGHADAAELQAAGDVEISGGFSGKEKGVCRAGGQLKARYLAGVTAHVAGDVTVRAEIATSRIVCMGKLTVEGGAILSGHLTVNGGVTCQAAGNESGTRLLIEVGINEALRQACEAKIPEIEATLQKAQNTRRAIEPLMRNQKLLSAKQKEQATELLYQASEIEDQVKAELLELTQQQEEGRKLAQAEVRITETIQPGVTIRLPGLEATIRVAMRGPLRLMARKMGQGLQIVAVDDRGGLLPLETRAYEEKHVSKLEQLLSSIRQVNA